MCLTKKIPEEYPVFNNRLVVRKHVRLTDYGVIAPVMENMYTIKAHKNGLVLTLDFPVTLQPVTFITNKIGHFGVDQNQGIHVSSPIPDFNWLTYIPYIREGDLFGALEKLLDDLHWYMTRDYPFSGDTTILLGLVRPQSLVDAGIESLTVKDIIIPGTPNISFYLKLAETIIFHYMEWISKKIYDFLGLLDLTTEGKQTWVKGRGFIVDWNFPDKDTQSNINALVREFGERLKERMLHDYNRLLQYAQ